MGAPTTGVIGSALTGAVTSAGYGAAIGGVTSLATGGDFSQGAAMGAAGGLLTGGVTGALGAAGAPAAAPSVTMSSRGGGLLPTSSPAPAPVTAGVDPSTFVRPTAAIAPAGNGFGRFMGGVDKVLDSKFLNNPIVGQTVAGLGKGLLAGMAAKDDPQIDYMRERDEDIRDSYNVDPSVYDGPVADNDRPSPQEQWPERVSPRDGHRPRYRYNRNARRIEYG